MTVLRSLTTIGMRAAAEALASIRAGAAPEPDLKILDEAPRSVSTGLEFKPATSEDVQSRWHLAAWLTRSFAERKESLDVGAWSWLAMYMFDVLCPRSGQERKVREDARYLLEAGDYRKSHRHLLAGPFLLFDAHRDAPSSVRGLLATPPDAPGEVYEQLVTRKFIVTSRTAVTLATTMYFDKESGRLKRGAGGSGAGSPRRFSEVLQQFDLTYDLHEISVGQLAEILPKEFNKFLADT